VFRYTRHVDSKAILVESQTSIPLLLLIV